jgi:hypothetical protein
VAEIYATNPANRQSQWTPTHRIKWRILKT